MTNDNQSPKNLIIKHVKEHGRISVAQGKDLIRSEYVCDETVACEAYMARYVRSILASICDEEGERTTFSTKTNDGKRMYINVDTCDDKDLVKKVYTQLRIRDKGLQKSIKKCKKRMRVLEGQLSFLSESEA